MNLYFVAFSVGGVRTSAEVLDTPVKRLSERRRLREVRQTRSRLKKKIKRENRSILFRLRSSTVSASGLVEFPEKKGYPKKVILPLPTDVSLESNSKELFDWIVQFRSCCFDRSKRVTCDFVPVETIGPAAALVLTAELDRWRVSGKAELKSRNRLRVYKFDQWKPTDSMASQR